MRYRRLRRGRGGHPARTARQRGGGRDAGRASHRCMARTGDRSENDRTGSDSVRRRMGGDRRVKCEPRLGGKKMNDGPTTGLPRMDATTVAGYLKANPAFFEA